MKTRNYINALQFLLMVIVLITGAYHVREKSALPFTLKPPQLQIEKINGVGLNRVSTGMKLIAIDGYEFSNIDQLELYVDGKNIGDTVIATFEFHDNKITIPLRLIPFYSNLYIVLQLISGLSCLLIGWFVYEQKRQLKEARIFYVLMILTSFIILFTWGNYNIKPSGVGYVIRIIFSAAYVFGPVTFLYFTLSFPVEMTKQRLKIFRISIAVSFLIFCWMAVTFSIVVQSQDLDSYNNYLLSFNTARYFSAACIIGSIIIFIYSYRNLKEESDRRKLRWLLLGFIVGPLTFALLWVVPQAITGYGLIAEEFILLMMVAVPVTFGISITKYHIMDIDSFINRGTVYSVIFFVLFILYISGIAITIALVGSLTATSTIWVSMVISIIVALVFQPLKNAAQRIVDKIFFRKRYEFRNVAKAFSEKIDEEFFPEKIFEHFITELNGNLPVEKSAIALINTNNGNEINRHFEFNLTVDNNLINSFSGYINQKQLSHFGSEKWIEPGSNVKINLTDFTTDRSIVLTTVIPFENDFCLISFLGKKKSGLKYSYEDIDLIHTMLLLIKSSLEQFFMRQKLMRDLDEIEKLKELNRLKSYFVSLVSHELQTPLTSIKIFSELLQKNYSAADRNKKFLELMEGECDRLSALINNILNFAKIENGLVEFQKEKVDMKRIVEESITKMQYQLELNSFVCQVEYVSEPLIIYADADAITEVLFNLISNSIKYSGANKKIKITITKQSGELNLIFEDRGVGIATDEIRKIFSPYERAWARGGKIHGIGLGLTIVKNIIENHEAQISVESKIGEGTKFTITFPLVN